MTKKTVNETEALYTFIATIRFSKIALNEGMDLLRFGLLDDQDTTIKEVLALEKHFNEAMGNLDTMSRLVHSLQGNRE